MRVQNRGASCKVGIAVKDRDCWNCRKVGGGVSYAAPQFGLTTKRAATLTHRLIPIEVGFSGDVKSVLTVASVLILRQHSPTAKMLHAPSCA